MAPNTLRGRFDLDIDGKSVPVLLNMNSLRLLTENEEIPLAEFDKEIQKNPLSFIPRLLYWGAVNMAIRAGKTAKAVAAFDVFAAHVCEDDEKFAELAEKVAEVFAGGKDGKAGK